MLFHSFFNKLRRQQDSNRAERELNISLYPDSYWFLLYDIYCVVARSISEDLFPAVEKSNYEYAASLAGTTSVLLAALYFTSMSEFTRESTLSNCLQRYLMLRLITHSLTHLYDSCEAFADIVDRVKDKIEASLAYEVDEDADQEVISILRRR